MQLDKTHVVVRLRTMSEIGDLALVMIRRYPRSFLMFACGAIGWALANFCLLGWIPINEYGYGLDDEEAFWEVVRYAHWMAVLVILQAPIAGIFMTSYLGQAVFEEVPRWSWIWRETSTRIGACLWVLGFKRLAIPAMMVLAARWYQPASSFWDGFIPLTLLSIALLIRSNRPFLPEILLLERCPLKSNSVAVISARRRSQSLHRPVAGDMSGRFITVAFVTLGVFLSLFYSLFFVRGIVTGLWNYLDLVVLLVVYPLTLWLVAWLNIIVRFLVYLDTRIRLEGWEVELAIQAEAMRQFGDQAVPVNRHRPESSSAVRSESAVPVQTNLPSEIAR